MPSAKHLPELGLQWIDRRHRGQLRAVTSRALPAETPRALAINLLLDTLPSTDDLARDARVWRALTLHHREKDWALAAMNSHQLDLAILVDRVVPEHLKPEDRDYESLRLTSLVLGATEAVCSGAIRPDASVLLVQRHLREVASAWQGLTRTSAS